MEPAGSEDPLLAFANYKTNARFYAKGLKQYFANSPGDLLVAERNYMQAQTAINLWVEDIQSSIKAGKSPNASPRFSAREQRAQAATDQFIQYAQFNLNPNIRPKFLGLAEVGQLVLNLAVQKIGAVVNERAERKKKLLAEEAAQLDQYKWESFEAIK